MIHKKAYGTGKHSGVIEALIKQCNDNEKLILEFFETQYKEMSDRLEDCIEKVKKLNKEGLKDNKNDNKKEDKK